MPPVTITAPFLASHPSPGTVLQEQGLLARLAEAQPSDVFAVADQLKTLYFQHMRQGGIQGRLWLDEFRRTAAGMIVKENLFAHFLHFSGSEASLVLPSDVAPPPGLRFSEEIGHPAVIALHASRLLFSRKASYFHLPELFFEDDLVLPEAFAEARRRIDEQKDKCAVQVTQHFRSGQLLVRSDAALCKALFEAGYPYVLGWIGHEDSFPPPPFRIGDLRVAARPIKDQPRLAPIPPSPFVLEFKPRRDLEFSPCAVTLIRNGRPYPVVMEQQDFSGLISLAPQGHRSELEKHRDREENGPSIPLLIAVRSPDGVLEGYSLNYFSQDRMLLRCQHTSKIDRDSRTSIQYFGLALTIAGLMFLKEKGWGPLLTNFYASVSSSYREQLGIPSRKSYASDSEVDSISREEAEVFLQRNPFHFETIR